MNGSGPIDFADELNGEQLAAVQAPDGPVLVIAAAGTGKTRTLVYRVAWLAEQGVRGENMLLLTFTNRAANEMLERARKLAGPAVGGMLGGTFHHLCNRMLRRDADRLGFRADYTILDADDAKSIARGVVQELGLTDRQFPKPDVILSLYSYAQNTEGDVEKMVSDRYKHHPADVDDIMKVIDGYISRKHELQAMDFDDLLVNGVRLLEEYPDIAAHYQERFRYIMVDEYQDTNVVQARLVDLLAAKHKNLLVVGDDFQSIYSWRGANFRNIIEFPQRYEGTNVFKLETNYRSIPQILSVANGCIAGNPDQFQKTLRAVRPEARRPIFVQPPDGMSQARHFIDRIRTYQREGIALKDICILYRSHFHSMEMQLELARESVPYVITSGVRFFEQAHIKDACALLRIMQNNTDELAFVRLLGLMPRVGDRTARKVWRGLDRRFDWGDLFQRQRLIDLLPKGAKLAWQKLDQLFDTAGESQWLADEPAELVYEFVNVFYEEYAIDSFDNADRRLEDVQELGTFVAQFDSLAAFLEEMALLTNMDAEKLGRREEEDQDAVRLSTVHQAKGLEWPVVMVVWMADGMFPSARSVEEDGDDTEERRLFYVAVTRAEDELVLSAPQMRRQRDGTTTYHSTSRFVRELGDGLLQKEHVGYM